MSLLQRLRARLQPASPAPAPPPREEDAAALVRAYHDETRHFPGRYARSAGYLDWDTQPDPFRRYDGAPLIRLPICEPDQGPPIHEAIGEGNTCAAPLDRATLSQFLRDSMGLSAWKRAGDAQWPLRVNPSSGNLHPTEAYLLVGAVEGLEAPFHALHYRPDLHGLEARAALSRAAWEALALPAGAFLVGLSSIHWREAWKYGERAYRYCQLDVGHAIAALSYAAAAQGWRLRLLPRPDDEAIASLLGIDAQQGEEAEQPDALLLVSPMLPAPWQALDPSRALLAEALPGRPRALSPSHEAWPILDVVARAARRTGPPGTPAPPRHVPSVAPQAPSPGLRGLLHRRRSAVAMDGVTHLPRAALEALLARLLPSSTEAPASALPGRPGLHLLLWLHRVEGLPAGRYLLVREPDDEADLRAAMEPAFAWEPVSPGLPFYRLSSGDVRYEAASVACGQGIAGDGAFAVAMLADLDRLRTEGPFAYRSLHWEAGLVGQQLYIEAEAIGLRGTGIGCFFDAQTRAAVGLRGDRWHPLYHFTVGGPVEDTRLQTLPPYPGP